MSTIKFGTDGWRAIIGKDFTTDNVLRVADATAKWLKKNNSNPSVVIGHDCRFGGPLFVDTAIKVFLSYGIKVYCANKFTSTPMISLGTVKLNASLGIVITASHNPPSYNGYKIKGAYGGPLLPEKIKEIELLISEKILFDVEYIDLELGKKKNELEYVDLEEMYYQHVLENFDIEAIQNSGLNFAYDSMFGAGRSIMKKLFPNIIHLHNDDNPGFHGQAPEPIHKNLEEISNLIKSHKNIDCGICTDGDADRIGLYDNKGNFIDSHHIILLLIKYLVTYKKFTGKVATAFSVSPRVEKLCKHLDLTHITTPIGFKFVADYIINDDVLLGGEESGGMAIKGHIPERDGIWIGLTILEYMAKTNKSISTLIKDVYKITGSFAYQRNDLTVSETVKQHIIDFCKNNKISSIGNLKVLKKENIDGWKFHLENEQWVMIRASGTEPVLRLYAESDTAKNADALLKDVEAILYNN